MCSFSMWSIYRAAQPLPSSACRHLPLFKRPDTRNAASVHTLTPHRPIHTFLCSRLQPSWPLLPRYSWAAHSSLFFKGKVIHGFSLTIAEEERTNLASLSTSSPHKKRAGTTGDLIQLIQIRLRTEGLNYYDICCKTYRQQLKKTNLDLHLAEVNLQLSYFK